MTPRSVLVYVGLDLVGDGLMKLPFLRALRAAYPDAQLTWLAGMGKSAYAGSLAPLVDGLLDEVIDEAGIGDSVKGLIGRRPLNGRSFDLIIDTQRRVVPSLVLRRIRHQRFITAAGEFWLSDVKPARKTRPKGMVAQMLMLLELAIGRTPDAGPVPLRLPDAAESGADALLPDGGIPIALAPGAGGKHKCWPLAHFTDLAARLRAQGATPLFILGPQEAEWREELETAGFAVRSPASVAETIALAKRCRAGVANDSGTGHMFAAADLPLVSLFGPTSPAKFAPAADPLTVLAAPDFAEGRAMVNIPVEAVLRAVDDLIATE